ncbi:hypothetical protein AHIS1_p054 [Acaryochloris phage A-HIS1]|nr:hypothetical protein AHIS1_p054 [Acaryochloris phage A-HIS1]
MITPDYRFQLFDIGPLGVSIYVWTSRDLFTLLPKIEINRKTEYLSIMFLATEFEFVRLT